MTTIAYRDGVMAFDTQMSCGTLKRRCVKAFKLKDGSLFGITGPFADGLRLMRWAADGYKGDAPKVDDESGSCCIHVRHDGIYMLDSELELFAVTDAFLALGSGSEIATGAMAMGATALEAVEVAAGFDSGTSAPFNTLRLGAAKANRSRAAKLRTVK